MRRASDRPSWAAMVTLLVVVGPGCAIAAGPAGRVPRHAAPVVVDGADRVLGPVVGGEGPVALVEMVIAGRALQLFVDGQRVLGSTDSLAYQSSNCTGEPFLLLDSAETPLSEPVAMGPGNILYGAAGPPLTLTITSSLTFFGCQSFPPETTSVYPTVLLADVDTLDPPIVPPLRIRP